MGDYQLLASFIFYVRIDPDATAIRDDSLTRP